MPESRPVRTLEDLERAVRAIATGFASDEVFIIGSQSLLQAWPDAPVVMRASPEIDAYPGNARLWAIREKAKHPNETPEASEHMDALFGSGSWFHRTHGFYIDGVDENTATLPAGWQTRAVIRRVDVGGRIVTSVAQSHRSLDAWRRRTGSFIEAYHSVRPLDRKVIEERIGLSNFEAAIAHRAREYIRGLTRKNADPGCG
jgi:hypothetical protein